MIKLIKSGDWAVRGVDIVSLRAGDVTDLGAVENSLLVTAGWAKWHEEKAEAEEAPRRVGRPPKA